MSEYNRHTPLQIDPYLGWSDDAKVKARDRIERLEVAEQLLLEAWKCIDAGNIGGIDLVWMTAVEEHFDVTKTQCNPASRG